MYIHTLHTYMEFSTHTHTHTRTHARTHARTHTHTIYLHLCNSFLTAIIRNKHLNTLYFYFRTTLPLVGCGQRNLHRKSTRNT